MEHSPMAAFVAASPPYVINEARYAKGKRIIRTLGNGGYKSRACRLAGDGLGLHYVGRSHGYVASASQAERFERLYQLGFDASSYSGAIDHDASGARDMNWREADKLARKMLAAESKATIAPEPIAVACQPAQEQRSGESVAHDSRDVVDALREAKIHLHIGREQFRSLDEARAGWQAAAEEWRARAKASERKRARAIRLALSIREGRRISRDKATERLIEMVRLRGEIAADQRQRAKREANAILARQRGGQMATLAGMVRRGAAELAQVKRNMADPAMPERGSDIARLMAERDAERTANAALRARAERSEAAALACAEAIEALASRVARAEAAVRAQAA